MSSRGKRGGGQQGQGQQTPRRQQGNNPNNPTSPSSPTAGTAGGDPNATAGGDPNNVQTGAPAPAQTGGNPTAGGAPAPAPPGGANQNQGNAQIGGAPAPTAVVPFALNPGVAMGNVILDYNQKTAKWLWDTTTKSLYAEAKDKFDLLQTQVPTWLTKVALRLALVGSSILHIFSRLKNICQCHAEFTLAQFKVKALTYMHTPTRLAQDDDTFAAMLWNSISDSAIATMALQSADYTINGAVSGLLLFKCLLLNSKVKATHNASLIIRKLSKALFIMREVGHDVTKFIFIYRGLLSDLSALGQSYLHSKTHVEEALLDHPDEQFVRYIQASTG